MHEMSLAQSIVEIVERTAKENHSNKVVSVRLIVGKLSGVEMHSLMQLKSSLTDSQERLGA